MILIVIVNNNESDSEDYLCPVPNAFPSGKHFAIPPPQPSDHRHDTPHGSPPTPGTFLRTDSTRDGTVFEPVQRHIQRAAEAV